ncbi:hypothetical protein ACFD85_000795 [Campylobacter coli]
MSFIIHALEIIIPIGPAKVPTAREPKNVAVLPNTPEIAALPTKPLPAIKLLVVNIAVLIATLLAMAFTTNIAI